MTPRIRIPILLLLLPVLAAAADGEAIAWRTHDDGLAFAAETGRMIMVDFHADWCKYCKKMDRETFTDPEVIRLINAHFVPVSVDTQRRQDLARVYHVESLPTIWFLEKDGSGITPLSGFVPAENFRDVLRYIATRSYGTMSFDAFLKGESDTP